MTTAPGTNDALDFLSQLVLQNGRHWAEAAEPAQWEDARAVLARNQAEREQQERSAPEHLHLLRRRGAAGAGRRAAPLRERLTCARESCTRWPTKALVTR